MNKYAGYIIISLFLILQCKSSGEIRYDSRNIFTGVTSVDIETKDRIDKGRTYELFFTLKDNEDCIKVNLSGRTRDIVQNKDVEKKTYFILEKVIDISRFNSGSSVTYSEIGRNFDYSWNIEREIQICSSESDPIKRLNKNDTYRIRFTTFQEKNFMYSINILSENKVVLIDKIK